MCVEKGTESVKVVEPVDHLLHAIQRCVVLGEAQVFPKKESVCNGHKEFTRSYFSQVEKIT